MIWLLAHLLSLLFRQQARPATHRKTEKDTDILLMGDGGRKGVGEEPKHTTARKHGPLNIINFFTL
jgi:hypothetical protein